MLKSAASLVALLCTLAPAVFAQDTCKICSTVAVEYNVQRRSTVTSLDVYTVTSGTKTVESGTRTIYLPKATTTITATIRQSYDYNVDFSQVSTTTVKYFNTPTTTVCPVVTPYDPVYCECQQTYTSTTSLPVTVYSYSESTAYNHTKTVRPTSYGNTETSTSIINVNTAFPTVSTVGFTKTLHPTTVTKTRAAYTTPTSLAFKLQVVDNPLYTSEPWVESVCYEYSTCDQYSLYYVNANGAKASEGTTFTIVDGQLYDSVNMVSCGYVDATPVQIYPGIPTYVTPLYLQCGAGVDNSTLTPAYVSIDCFGNLAAAAQGQSNTWALSTYGGTVYLLPQPDPVHGYSDSGNSDAFSYLYVDLKIKKV